MDNILYALASNRLIIYGTGYAAQNFYMALKYNRLEKNIESFVVSGVPKGKELFGIRIQNLEEVGEAKKYLFCIATHEAVLAEIEDRLKSRDIQNYIWVHPYIFRLCFGNVMEEKKIVDVRAIIQSQRRDNYFLAIRYLAIENYFQKNSNGFEIYRKALLLQCEMSTAKKREAQFKELIANWDRQGYRADYPISIDEEYRLVDGTHRFSLACYFGIKEICCDILPYSDVYGEVVKESHLMSEKMLMQAGFTDDEIRLIRETQDKLRDKYDGKQWNTGN